MKICFPVKEVQALESEVYGHFGSAPAFVFFDTETGSVTSAVNADMHHQPGMCNPLGAVQSGNAHAVVVGGIGGGALMKLQGAGISVYRAAARTIEENIELLRVGKLPEFQPWNTCGGHGSGCSH